MAENHPVHWWWIRHAPPLFPLPEGQENRPSRHAAESRDIVGHQFRPHCFMGATDWRPDCKDAAHLIPLLPRYCSADQKADDVIWLSSNLRRAKETAQALCDARAGTSIRPHTVHNLSGLNEQHFGDWPGTSIRPHTVHNLSGLNEQHFGDWEGTPYDAMEDMPGSKIVDLRPPGGESFRDLYHRVVTTIRASCAKYASCRPRHIITVAHAGVIRCAIAHALGIDLDRVFRIDLHYLSLTRLSFHGNTTHWSVDGMNITAMPQKDDREHRRKHGNKVHPIPSAPPSAPMPGTHKKPELAPLTFIFGGVRSGKSRIAQSLIEQRFGGGCYIATSDRKLSENDPQMRKRLEQHRKTRGKNWLLIEEPLNLATVLHNQDKERRVILIECLALWLMNVMDKGRDPIREWKKTRTALTKMQTPVVMVSSEVGLGAISPHPTSRIFCDHIGTINQDACDLADNVTMVIAGLARTLKGESF